jgi:hypothetical protein
MAPLDRFDFMAHEIVDLVHKNQWNDAARIVATRLRAIEKEAKLETLGALIRQTHAPVDELK